MHYSNALDRFLEAQQHTYKRALSEVRDGKKTSHWMWFIFPQLKGLGQSHNAHYYGIDTLEEAKEYLAQPSLRKNLLEAATTLLSVKDKSAEAIFGSTDSQKLRSSMTLFSQVENADEVFEQVLDKYFAGKRDERTLAMLAAAPR